MADIRVDGADLLVELTRLEKVEAVHGNLRLPLTSVREVKVVDRPLDLIHGLKLPGTGIPGSTAVGTWVSPDGSTFAVEHHASRGVLLRLEGQTYQQVVVGCDQREAVAERIRAAVGGLGA